MPAFEFSREHNAFVKKCTRCELISVGTREQAESEKMFLIDFFCNGQTADGLLGHCKKCQHGMIRRSIGVVGKYDTTATLKAQDGKCAICLEPIQLKQGRGGGAQLDHDHITGRVRGLLCLNCNQAIGKFKDSTTNLQRAIAYLIAFSCTPQ